MKRLMQFALVAGVVTMAVSPALAQQRQRGGGFGFGGNTIFLLGQKSVQEELKLSDEQIKKVQGLAEKQREMFQNFRDLSQEERREKMQELAKAVDKILQPQQLKRVKQIALQQAGVRAVNDEEVAKSLNVTDEQKEKIRDLQRKSFEEMQGLGRDEEGAKKRQEIMKATNEKMMAVLTAEQKTKLKEMQGEPFKGEIASPFGGRRNR